MLYSHASSTLSRAGTRAIAAALSAAGRAARRALLATMVGWLVASPCFCASPTDRPQERSGSEFAEYGLVAFVTATRTEPAQVALSFSRKIPHQELERALHQMAASGGWELAAVEMSDESPVPDAPAQTTASFTAKGIINWERGWLGVEPIVRQFANEGSIRVAFFVPGLRFTGPRGYDRNGVEVRLLAAGNPYEYEARVAPWRHRSAADTRDEPARVTPASTWLLAGALFVAALAVGIVVGRVWYGMKQTRDQTARRGEP